MYHSANLTLINGNAFKNLILFINLRSLKLNTITMARILWVDDEIEMLRPHIMFLEQKGYQIDAINNGGDALMLIGKYNYDLVFLDENMPGISGLDVLVEIKKINSQLPVIMITKSEEESIMEEAIGSNIADYLIKPVNPNQILLAIKKNIDASQIISDKNTMDYQRQFREIGLEMTNNLSPDEWIKIYKRLVDWELKLEKSEDGGILDIFQTQKDEANTVFSNFITRNYIDWLNGSDERPVQSQTAFREKVLPQLKENTPTFLFVIDNLRYDQWKTIYPALSIALTIIFKASSLELRLGAKPPSSPTVVLRPSWSSNFFK